MLKYAYLNSFYQTGLKNLLDVAVLDRKQEITSLDIDRDYHKFDEILIKFVRRRMSVIIAETGKDHVLICKGAVEEVLKVCTQLKVDDKILPIDESVHTRVADLQQKLNSDGLRVIAVAYKTIPIEQAHCAIADESDLILLGNIAFLDPPKDSAAQALKALKRNGVEVKILTGDNEIITQKICRDVGLQVQNVLLGSDIDSLADDKLAEVAATTTILLSSRPPKKPRLFRYYAKQVTPLDTWAMASMMLPLYEKQMSASQSIQPLMLPKNQQTLSYSKKTY